MRRSVAKIKGLGFMLWHAKHELVHILLGLLWAWVLREVWGSFNSKWIFWAVFGSLLPDADHLLYWVAYGRQDTYSKQVLSLLRNRQWRSVFLFLETGHKNVTDLISHNYFVTLAMLGLSVIAWKIDWEIGVILFGAMVIHYIFDILDDIIFLGYINPNWKRLGRKRQSKASPDVTYE